MFHAQRAAHAGVTLIEMIATLIVAAVLAAIALPQMGGLIEKQRAGTTLHHLSTTFAIARNTAIMRHVPVTICAAASPQQCSGGTDWSDGWLVYLDEPHQSQPQNPDMVIRSEDAPGTGQLRVVSTDGRRNIRFLPSGKSGGSNMTLRLCDEDNRLLGQLILNNVGRVRSERVDDGSQCP